MGFSVGSSEGYKYGKLDGCNHFLTVWIWCDFDLSKYGKCEGLALGV